MTTFTLSEKKQSLYSDYCQFLLASFTNFTQTGLTQIEQKKEILDLKSHYFGILTP